ncbi:MAG: hypothetical protein WCL53_08465 [Chloroflexota bacterium]
MSLYRFFRSMRFMVLPVAGVLTVISLSTAALANSNTFATAGNAAGQASQAVTGYTIAAPTYALNPTTPVNIDSVTFTAAGAVKPTQAWLKLSTAYRPCVVSGSTSPWTVTCGSGSSPLGEAVTAASTFDAIVAQ